MTDETPTVPDLDMVLQAIRVSNSPERWQESLRTYGPAVINDLNLLISLHNVASRLGGSDPEIANAITRWIEDLERKHSPHGLERLLISASSDAEIRQILEAHRHLVTPTFAMTALREVGRMCNTRSPIPVSLRGQATAPILHCVELIADFLGDEVVLAECHLMRSAVTSSTGDFAGSIPDLEIAAGMFEDRGDRFRQAQCVGLIGTNYLKLDRIEEAEGYLLRSVSLLEEHPEKDALLAPTYEELGQIAGRKNDLPTAGKYYSRAGQTRLRQGRTDKAALALQASVPFLLPEDEDQAFANADQFLALRLDTGKAGPSAELDETFMEIIARYLSGVVADAIDARDPLTGHSKNVNAEARLALAHRWALLAKRGLHMIKSAKARAYILFSAAAVALKNADPAAAAADAAAALPYFTSTDEDGTFVGVVQTLAEAERLCGHADRALETVETALAQLGQGDALATLTLQCLKLALLVSLGRVVDAIDTQANAMALARRSDDATHSYYQEWLVQAFATIYERVGRIEAAVPLQIEGLRVARNLASRSAEATQLCNLGIVCGKLTEPASRDLPTRERWDLLSRIAEEGIGTDFGAWVPGTPDSVLADRARELGTRLLDRAGEAYRGAGDLLGAAIVRGNRANFTLDREERLRELVEALAQVRSAGAPPNSEAVIIANMGKSYRALEKLTEATSCFLHSLHLAGMSGESEWAYDTAEELATTYLLRMMPDDAAKYLRLAVDYLEIGRRSLPLNDSIRVSFARRTRTVYARLVTLYIQHNRMADAFDAVQRAKSRALIDLSAIGNLQPTVPMPPDCLPLVERELALLNELRHLALGATAPADAPERRSLSSIRADLDQIYARLQPVDPRYVGKRSGRPVSFRELRQTLLDQKRPVLLVDYFVQPSALLIFLLRAEWDAPECVSLEIGDDTLAAWREDFEHQILRFRGQGPQTWTSMTEMLVAPIERYIQAEDLIYLVPHGALHGLPVHALPVGGGPPLIESHPVMYLPTASLLPLCQSFAGRSGRLDKACVIGVNFEEEAKAVAALFPQSELLIGDVSAERISEAVRACDVVHFSSHGHYDSLDPEKSGLVLRRRTGTDAQDAGAVLTAYQISQMRLASEIVCLSACQSGVGRLVQGDEQLGILRAIFLAGASSVISTLWPVDAEVAHVFVIAFYEQLLATFRETGRIDKSAAFRSAQQRMLQDHRQSGAYYWAPFVLSGDWT